MIRTPSKLLPNCGVLELFTRGECKDVVIGYGAIRMRSANDPWGPWTAPLDVLVGGDPDRLPLELEPVQPEVTRIYVHIRESFRAITAAGQEALAAN